MQSRRQAVALGSLCRTSSRLSVTAAVAMVLAQAGAGAGAEAPETRAGYSAPIVLAQNDAAKPITFDIKPQPMAEALTKLGEQSGLTIIVESKVSKGVKANALSGQYTPDEALKKLLEPAGLKAEYLDRKTVAVRLAGEKDSHTTRAGHEASVRRLAQNSQTNDEQSSSTDSRSESTGAEGADQKQSLPTGREGDVSWVERVEEIVVTGTHIRGARVASPSLTLTREDFARAGFSSVESVFESLPQNFDGVTQDGLYAAEGGSIVARTNTERVAAIDLRGLGPQATLTLVNGQRRAGSIQGRVVDVSAIPLSAIERVDIVTGGQSAIYGADAVAGVVNIVTRREFDGAETQLSQGMPTEYDGGGRLQASQLFGRKFARGGFVVAYDFSRDEDLDIGKAGMLSSSPTAAGQTFSRLNTQADMQRHSALLAGRYPLTDHIELHADALYMDRESDDLRAFTNAGAPASSSAAQENLSKQYSGSLGLHAGLGRGWTLAFAGNHSAADNDLKQNNRNVFATSASTFTSITDRVAGHSALSALLSGPFVAIGRIAPLVSLGAERRREDFSFDAVVNGASVVDLELDRDVSSAFLEMLIPLMSGTDDPSRHKLELSLAGRYDDYSDFGSTFRPKAGVIYTPMSDLTLRAAISSAFRAPALVDMLSTDMDAAVQNVTDPTQGGALRPVLFLGGASNPGLTAEEADTWSFGIDYRPAFAPWGRLSIDYFRAEYDKRIETPMTSAERPVVLAREARFVDLINRSPSIADIEAFIARDRNAVITAGGTGRPDFVNPTAQQLLAAFPNLILVDSRLNNIAVENLEALDFNLDTHFETKIGALAFGVNLTYTLDHERSVTPTSPVFSLLNEIGKPADLRFRASGGWSRGAWDVHLFANHVGDYVNPFSVPRSQMGAWTTLDMGLRFDGARSGAGGALASVEAILSASNLLDEAPPTYRNSFNGLLYDAANANPLGRFVTLRLIKRWR